MNEIVNNMAEAWTFVLEHRSVIAGIGLLWVGAGHVTHANEQLKYDMRDEASSVEIAIRQLEVRIYGVGWTLVATAGVILIVI